MSPQMKFVEAALLGIPMSEVVRKELSRVATGNLIRIYRELIAKQYRIVAELQKQ